MAAPKTAYVLLWFPKASETFIFREVINLMNLGLNLKVYSLYGRLAQGCSQEMLAFRPHVERLGRPFIKKMPGAIGYWRRRDPGRVNYVFKTLARIHWRGLEKTGENLWAIPCGFHLARRFEADGIEHIHAPWANGPATAAWVASMLTDIPFSFTARAWDIYPQDGCLAAKIKACRFVRTNTRTNARYLNRFTQGRTDKIVMIYNGLTLTDCQEAPVAMKPPFRLLSVGRFVSIKGFDVLIRAAVALKREGLDFRVTLAGEGPWEPYLKALTRSLGLEARVAFPGFIPHDRIPDLMRQADVLAAPSVLARSGDRDGIPNVILEALAHRLPVVASDVSGIGEVIRHEYSGLLVPPRRPEALALAIGRMFRDRSAALRLAEAGQTLVRREFDPLRNTKRLMDLFRDAV
ncbi:MAG: glycosyltransferase family 4 protein [Thermodesulfobacteriota bacterium]